MKRFLSILLVAMLIVTSLSTVAFAEAAQPGESKSFTVTVSGVSGDEFGNFGVQLSADAGITITAISGDVTANINNGMVTWFSTANVSRHSFSVEVKLADDLAPDTYNVYATVLKATKYVGEENDTEDGIVDGWVAASVSANGATFMIVEPECEHSWSKWTTVKAADCDEDGLETRTCSKSGEVEERVIPATGHTIIWAYDENNHWHVCSVCGEIIDEKEAHSMEKEWDYASGKYHHYCSEGCGYEYYKSAGGPIDPSEPETGDITPAFTAAVAALIAMVFAVVYLFKRRAVK